MKKKIRSLLSIVLSMSLIMTMLMGMELTAFAATPVVTEIMTAGTGGTSTGLFLTGDRQAVFDEDYTYEEDSREIIIETSGWKISGTVDSAFNGKKLEVYLGDSSSDTSSSFIIGDINQNGSKLEFIIRSGKSVTATIEAESEFEVDTVAFFANDGVASLLLNTQKTITLNSLVVQGTLGAKIKGPGTVNACECSSTAIDGTVTFDNVNVTVKKVTAGETGSTAAVFMGAVEVINNSKLVAISELAGEEEDPSCGIYFYGGSLYVDDSSELFASGKDTAILILMSPGAIADLSEWKCSSSQIDYSNKNTVTDDAEEVEIDEETSQYKVKDFYPVAIAKTMYKASAYQNPIPPEPYGDYLSSLDEKFEYAITTGSTETISWKGDGALPNYIMKKLFNNPSLSLDYKFTYEGVEHEVYIGPGQATNDDIEWFGPMWLLGQYGEKSDAPAVHGEYVIAKGDTLNKLATKFNTTVDELMRLNPYIKDRNKIYPGNTLKY